MTFDWAQEFRKDRLAFEEREKKARSKGSNNPLLDLINARSKINMDSRIIVEGEAGVGKSWFCLLMGEIVDSKFKDNPIEAVENQVCFTAQEFAHAVTILPTKSVIIFDEGAQAWHHRDFQRQGNIVLSKIQIGFRYKRFITMLCVPYLELVDKDARGLAHFLVNIKKHGVAEAFRIQTPKFEGHLFFSTIVDFLAVGQPGVKLRNAYESKKERVQSELYSKFSKELDFKEAPKESVSEIVAKIREAPAQYMERGRDGRLYVPAIQALHKLGRSKADTVRAAYEVELEKDRG